MARNCADDCIKQSFRYEKTRWDESYIELDIKEGDLVYVSRVHFRNISSNPKFRESFIGSFLILRLVGMNAV
ncbi:hypothetical protein CROQUDRAFT_687197 [Cronartium quercuum f. sp. fusiforme G11]|uniref:Uncharacterized protein n=1 Tax=Cronartium quercuum f. sp. fusiforme G11 TaxID=708437 RepID=A0A9P6NB22_9BASI|nr:hypothetical protein CROQUDRAFT_687197 [Cronartium quercuum f. sp. fusiforme G11]